MKGECAVLGGRVSEKERDAWNGLFSTECVCVFVYVDDTSHLVKLFC